MGIFFSCLYIVAIALFLVFRSKGSIQNLYLLDWGDVMGRATVPTGAAILVAVPWAIVERVFRIRSNGPFFGGLIFFVVIFFLSSVGSRPTSLSVNAQSADSQEYTLTLPSCEFSVSFPAQPKIQKLQKVSENGEFFAYQQANLATRTEYLRAECLPENISLETATDTLRRQAIADGLENVAIAEETNKVIKLRGYKTIVGHPATYEIWFYLGAKSTLILMISAASKEFPTDGTIRFLASVK